MSTTHGTLSFLTNRPLIAIPGPNPILIPGNEDEWDGSAIEAACVIKDADTYYLYYHGWPKDSDLWRGGYRIGVATANHPTGPWRKAEENPLIELGEEGTWDDGWVACAAVLKEEDNRYFMFYNGNDKVGLAYAEHPLGPWKKYEKNPIMEEKFGYVGSVLKVGDTYRMYNEYPINMSPDQGPFALATAERPEGPWKIDATAILTPDSHGSWDSGGYSESGVLYHDGVFHTFYGGTKWERQPTEWKSAFESIGYAASIDGTTFTKHVDNPVVPRERSADASALSEVHCLWEAPYYYLFHTLRFILKDTRKGFGEYIGMHTVATRSNFRISMPLISISSLDPGQTTPLDNRFGDSKKLEGLGCPPVSLEPARSVSITCGCTYSQAAAAALRIHVKSSWDGMVFDTEDLCSIDMPCRPGVATSMTRKIEAEVLFIKLQIENLDSNNPVTDITARVTLGG